MEETGCRETVVLLSLLVCVILAVTLRGFQLRPYGQLWRLTPERAVALAGLKFWNLICALNEDSQFLVI